MSRLPIGDRSPMLLSVPDGKAVSVRYPVRTQTPATGGVGRAGRQGALRGTGTQQPGLVDAQGLSTSADDWQAPTWCSR